MADISDVDFAPPVAPPMKRAINWGGVIKGVAIVAAAVVVGYVIYPYVASAVSAYLTSPTAFGAEAVRATLSTVTSIGSSVWGFVSGAAVSLGNTIGIPEFWNSITSAYHNAGAIPFGTSIDYAGSSAYLPVASTGAGYAAAGAAGLATLGAAKAIVNPHFTEMVPAHDPITMAKAGHATHEHGGVREAAAKSDNWVARTSGAKAQHANFREAVDASRTNASEVKI